MCFFFYLFSILAILGSIFVVISNNPVYSVFSLITVFCNISGLFILLGAEFIAMNLIIVYVGALAVLFLFVTFMLKLNINFSLRKFIKENISLSIILAFFLLIDLLAIIKLALSCPNNLNNLPIVSIINDHTNNAKIIGELLYTDFILPFQSTGIILFIAMISSIILLSPKKSKAKKQITKLQLMRNKENSIIKTKPQLKSGINDL